MAARAAHRLDRRRHIGEDRVGIFVRVARLQRVDDGPIARNDFLYYLILGRADHRRDQLADRPPPVPAAPIRVMFPRFMRRT